MRNYSHDTTETIQSLVPLKPPMQVSPFRGHTLRPAETSVVKHTDYQPAWIFGILLGASVILTWVVYFHRKRLVRLVFSGFSKRNLNQLLREGDPFKEWLTPALSMVYVMMLALLVYQVNKFIFGVRIPNLPDFLFYLFLVLAISIFWVIKLFLMRFLRMIFRTETTNYLYVINILIFTGLTGILLLPVLLLATYLQSPVFLLAASALSGLLFLIRFLKGFLIGFSLTRFSYLFLFVYLCGLELLPVLILTKVLIRFIIPVF